jgi:DNA-binding MarR family transcriptional regulator
VESRAGNRGSRLGAESVGFVLSQLGFETSRRFGELVGTLGLEPRHFAILRAVQRHEGQSQHAVAEGLEIPPSTMVALVDALELQELLERRLQGSDRRTRTLHLTPQGAAVVNKGMNLASQLEQTICAGIDQSERAHLVKLLGRLAENLGLARDALPDKGSGKRPPHSRLIETSTTVLDRPGTGVHRSPVSSRASSRPRSH